MEKITCYAFFVALLMVTSVVSAMPTISVDMVTSPDTVNPGDTVNFNILINYNGDGAVADHSDSTIEFDPAYITIDPIPAFMDSPIGPGGTCFLSGGGDDIICDDMYWGFGKEVNNGLLFSTPLTGTVKAGTPPGTKIATKVCTAAFPHGETDYVAACSEPHYILVESGNDVPEFPSAFIPAVAIIGFLGAVFYIRGTREY